MLFRSGADSSAPLGPNAGGITPVLTGSRMRRARLVVTLDKPPVGALNCGLARRPAPQGALRLEEALVLARDRSLGLVSSRPIVFASRETRW